MNACVATSLAQASPPPLENWADTSGGGARFDPTIGNFTERRRKRGLSLIEYSWIVRVENNGRNTKLRRQTIMATATLVRADEEIQKDVLAEMKWHAHLQPNEIGVSVKDGVVALTGWVDSYLKKWSAEDAAHRVAGVKAVANDLEVKLASERTDADIAQAAIHALEWDVFVPADRIKVTVSKGWVTLKGEVEWQYQREDAERAVRRLVGVKGVSNLITVVPRTTAPELKKKIEDALVRNAELDAKKITVAVQGNKAILRGSVRSWAEKEEAARIAWSAPGITSVENNIIVED
jgi:osmotically-inducible protein OsmY